MGGPKDIRKFSGRISDPDIRGFARILQTFSKFDWPPTAKMVLPKWDIFDIR
uniref:Uncharacterized protein n=1 Tax=Meloidogyne enterolobii TaxID=390850 RepID=A0A6V7UFW1_MELEN|nr:unnamed protein product [Meloidogyne enterolobii]